MDIDDKRKRDTSQLATADSKPTANQGGSDNSGRATPAATTQTSGTTATGAPNVITVGDDANMDFETALAQARARAKTLREQAGGIGTSVPRGNVDWRAELDRVRNEYLESDEARAKRERQERAQRKIAALADGFAALSNMGGAMAGATPIKQVSLSAAQKAAADKAKELRRRDKAAYELAYHNIMARKAADDKAYAYRVDNLRDSLLKRAEDIDGDILKAVADKTKHEADLNERKRHNREQEQILRYKASKSGSGGSGGSGGNKYYGTFGGVAYKTKADYDKAVIRAAKTNNVPTYAEDKMGHRQYRKTDEIAADVERRQQLEIKKQKLKKLYNTK